MEENQLEVLDKCIKEMGYCRLKPEQKEAIMYYLQGNDVFIVLPTGFGKSLCYGCLPLVYDTLGGKEGSIVVVISPLIALMKDQACKFSEKGLSAVQVGECSKEVNQHIIDGEYQLVFVSPEAILGHRRWRKMLSSSVYQQNLVGLVIDEVHYVRTWYVYCSLACQGNGVMCSTLVCLHDVPLKISNFFVSCLLSKIRRILNGI